MLTEPVGPPLDDPLPALRRMLRIGRRLVELFPPLHSPRWAKGDPAMVPVAQMTRWLAEYEPVFAQQEEPK